MNGLLTITDGDLDVSTNGPNVQIAGGMIIGANGSIDLSAYSGAWTYDGSGTLTDNRVTKGDLKTFTIDGTAATLTLGSNIKATSITIAADDTFNLGAGSYTLELTGTGTSLTATGTFNKGTGSTVNYTGSGTATNVAAVAYNNLTFTPSLAVTYSLTGDLTGGNAIAGGLTINSGAILDTNSKNISVTGATVINSGAALNLDGTSAASSLTISNTLTNNGALTLEDDTNTLSIIGSGALRTFTGNDIDYNMNSVTLTNIDYDPDVQLDETGDKIVLGDSNCVFDGISIGVGSAASTFNAGAYNFAMSGNFTNTASGVFTSTGTAVFNGVSNQTVTPCGTDANHDFQNITHTGAGNFILGGNIDIDGTLTQNNAASDIDPSASNYTLTAADLILTDGTINTNARAGILVISDDVTITSGILTAPAVMYVGGDWNNTGTFIHNSGTVEFNGAGVSTISGNTTFNNLSSTTAGKVLNFASGATQIISGALTLTGASGNFITLGRSGGTGLDQWNIDVDGTSDVSYVSVSNSKATGRPIPTRNSVNAGNNTGWSFNSAYFKVTGLNAITTDDTVTATITAYDQYGNVATDYIGDNGLIFSGAHSSIIPVVNPTAINKYGQDKDFGEVTVVTFSEGIGTAVLKLYKAETIRVNVTDGTISSSGDPSYGLNITVSAGIKNKLLWVTQPHGTVTEGVVWNTFSVEITDYYGNRTVDTDRINVSPGAGGFSGSPVVSASAGLAVFNNVNYLLGGNITVIALGSGLVSTPASNGVMVNLLQNFPEVRQASSVLYSQHFPVINYFSAPMFIPIGPAVVAVPVVMPAPQVSSAVPQPLSQQPLNETAAAPAGAEIISPVSSFESIRGEAVSPVPIVNKDAFEGVNIIVELPSVVIDKTIFDNAAAGSQLISPVSFEGIQGAEILPAIVNKEVFNGVTTTVELPPVVIDKTIFDNAAAGSQLISPVSFEGIQGAEIFPAAVVNEQAVFSQPIFEEAKSAAVLSKPINPEIFKEVSGEVKVKVTFPGGIKVIPTYGIGVPLGAEKPLLEPKIKQEKDKE